MKNVEIIMGAIRSNRLHPGCISNALSKIHGKYLDRIKDAIDAGQDTDIPVMCGCPCIAEVFMEGLCDEVDIYIVTAQEYKKKYGEYSLEGKEW